MAYRMTPARRAALRKAQAASARKRRGKGKGKLAAANRRARRNARIAMAAGGLAGAAAIAGYAYGDLSGRRKLTTNVTKSMSKKSSKSSRPRKASPGSIGNRHKISNQKAISVARSVIKYGNAGPPGIGVALDKRYGYGYKPGRGSNYWKG